MMQMRYVFAVSLAVAALAVSVVVLTSQPAAAQENDTRALFEQIDRLRGDITDLQRYIFRGETPPAGFSPPAGAAEDPDAISRAARGEVRIGVIEDEMRSLTGRIEEVAHAIDVIGSRLDKLVADVDFRLTAIERGQSAAGPVAMAPENQGVAPSIPSTAGASQVLGTIPVTPAPAATGTDTAAVRPALPPGTPQQQYRYAYDLLRQMEYGEAERALTAFVAAHPDHKLTGNAYYWLAETFYVRGEYEQAVSYFASGYRDYPDSVKATDNLLKLAMSLARLDRKKDACITFKELGERFPNASPAIKQRAVNEGRRAGCT